MGVLSRCESKKVEIIRRTETKKRTNRDETVDDTVDTFNGKKTPGSPPPPYPLARGAVNLESWGRVAMQQKRRVQIRPLHVKSRPNTASMSVYPRRRAGLRGHLGDEKHLRERAPGPQREGIGCGPAARAHGPGARAQCGCGSCPRRATGSCAWWRPPPPAAAAWPRLEKGRQDSNTEGWNYGWRGERYGSALGCCNMPHNQQSDGYNGHN